MSRRSVALASENDFELRVTEGFVARMPFGLFHFQVGVQRRHVIAEDRYRGLEEIVPPELRRVPRIVVAAGGARKTTAVRAALKALPVHVLVTDESVAAGLLAA